MGDKRSRQNTLFVHLFFEEQFLAVFIEHVGEIGKLQFGRISVHDGVVFENNLHKRTLCGVVVQKLEVYLTGGL